MIALEEEFQPTVDILTWSEARELVLPLNPTLVNQIDPLSPSKHLKIYRVQYRYGDRIHGENTLKLSKTSEKLYGDFPTFSKVPFGLVLKNSIEASIEIEGRMIPTHVFRAGDLFGIENIEIVFNQ